MTSFYDLLLTLLTPFIYLGGFIDLPKRKVDGSHYYKFRDKINVGTVLLTKSNWAFSNLYNPAKMKHAGIYVGRVLQDDVCYVFEATRHGAVLTDLVSFLTSKDRVIGCDYKYLTPRFAEVNPKTVLTLKGLPYDYLFKPTGKALYCFELCVACLNVVYPSTNFKVKEIIKNKKIYDHNTFLDENMFTIVFDTKKD